MNGIEHSTEEQLIAYAADSLAPGEADAVGRHLLECAACRSRLPAPTPEQFWSALLVDEPVREEVYKGENLASAQSSFSRGFTFWRQPAALGAFALMLIAAFSFLIWRGASKQTNREPEVTLNAETPKMAEISNARNNTPTTQNSPDVTPSEPVQTVENQNNSRQQQQPRSAKPESNSPDTTEAPNEQIEADDREVAQLLETTPPAISSLRPNEETVLRGSNGKEDSGDATRAFALLAPVGETVLETAPEFRWEKASGAIGYRVSILDENFNEVEAAEVAENSFLPSKPLKRGAKYLWRVAAQTAENGEIIAPKPPSPPAVFGILSENAERQIHFLKKNKADRLKLAVYYAREGMLDPAACTLKEILAKTPDRRDVRRLLRRIERWQKENNSVGGRCD